MLPMIRAITARSLETGILGPIDTQFETIVDDCGIRLRIAKITNLERKKAARLRPGNPFLDPEPELILPLELPKHHILLNKFPVFESHALIVTKAFAPQTDALNLEDFEALHSIRERYAKEKEEWLCFYNHGPLSGQSQPHKHLQMVPYPIEGASTLEEVLDHHHGDGKGVRLRFQHFWSSCRGDEDAETLFTIYKELLASSLAFSQSGNFLMTRRRMLVVPRAAECFQGTISMNSLAFAFALLGASQNDWNALCDAKLGALESVCYERPKI